jgi:hypothetical protein
VVDIKSGAVAAKLLEVLTIKDKVGREGEGG